MMQFKLKILIAEFQLEMALTPGQVLKTQIFTQEQLTTLKNILLSIGTRLAYVPVFLATITPLIALVSPEDTTSSAERQIHEIITASVTDRQDGFACLLQDLYKKLTILQTRRSVAQDSTEEASISHPLNVMQPPPETPPAP